MKRVNDPNYYNFEFNCIGTCDASYRESRDSKKSLTPEEYASIRRFSSLPHVAFTEKLGVYSWELVVAIPFRLMGLDPDNLPEKIMGNFYKCADDTEFPHFVSWSPIDLPSPNFHCPEFFRHPAFRVVVEQKVYSTCPHHYHCFPETPYSSPFQG